MKLQPARFTMDSLGDGVWLEGFSAGETWNGWACPYFAFEQAQRVVEVHRERSVKARYNEATDQFTFDLVQTGEEDVDAFASVDIGGRKLYRWARVLDLGRRGSNRISPTFYVTSSNIPVATSPVVTEMNGA